ncbi:MAG: hypothetical protein Ct9H300mP25_00090 [Acidobacteriota bacterium]|nr:MAG: hypothetical protein Ct9H300mP25_00090 [Acidobacteriota bacterium]
MQKRSTVFGLVGVFLVMSSSVLALDLPLHEAVVAGDLDRVRVLIADGVDVNTVDGDGTTALHWAAHHDDLESGRELVAAGADPTRANQFGAQPIAWRARMVAPSSSSYCLMPARIRILRHPRVKRSS